MIKPSQKKALAEKAAERQAPDPQAAQAMINELANRSYGAEAAAPAAEAAQAAPAASPGRGRPAAAVPRRSITLSLPEPMVEAIELAAFQNKRAKSGEKTASGLVEKALADAGWPVDLPEE
ncbi:hypothetical protein BJP27_24245 (plasmid) [Pseudomonas oryzihabitans]|nr:hypothetical protein BJP27_24245 [Pseudomonas psychrotolerans]